MDPLASRPEELPAAVEQAVRRVAGRERDAPYDAGTLLLGIPASVPQPVLARVEAVLASAPPDFWLAITDVRARLFGYYYGPGTSSTHVTADDSLPAE